MKLIAPAKVNWTLEVIGRRGDGYHEVRTVMQTVEPCDELELLASGEIELSVEGPHEVREDDLVLCAAGALDRGGGRGADIGLGKRIPVGAGLGGGSSDAAAALRGLNELWGLGHDGATLTELASQLGSDVPFFLRGGTALAKGRGERVTPLPDVSPMWLVLLAPPFHVSDKTKSMYEALSADDFSDGSRTEAMAERIRKAGGVREEDLFNAFERAAFEVFEGLDAYREALLSAGARRVLLAGAGPALFALGPDEESARSIQARLRTPGGEAFVARTLTVFEATRRDG